MDGFSWQICSTLACWSAQPCTSFFRPPPLYTWQIKTPSTLHEKLRKSKSNCILPRSIVDSEVPPDWWCSPRLCVRVGCTVPCLDETYRKTGAIVNSCHSSWSEWHTKVNVEKAEQQKCHWKNKQILWLCFAETVKRQNRWQQAESFGNEAISAVLTWWVGGTFGGVGLYLIHDALANCPPNKKGGVNVFAWMFALIGSTSCFYLEQKNRKDRQLCFSSGRKKGEDGWRVGRQIKLEYDQLEKEKLFFFSLVNVLSRLETVQMYDKVRVSQFLGVALPIVVWFGMAKIGTLNFFPAHTFRWFRKRNAR